MGCTGVLHGLWVFRSNSDWTHLLVRRTLFSQDVLSFGRILKLCSCSLKKLFPRIFLLVEEEGRFILLSFYYSLVLTGIISLPDFFSCFHDLSASLISCKASRAYGSVSKPSSADLLGSSQGHNT